MAMFGIRSGIFSSNWTTIHYLLGQNHYFKDINFRHNEFNTIGRDNV